MSMTNRKPRWLETLFDGYDSGMPPASTLSMNNEPPKTLTPHQLRKLIIDRLERDTTLGLTSKLDPEDIDHLAGGLATVLAGTTIGEM